MELYLGFDPGGAKDRTFGWAVCSSEASVHYVLSTGKARHAKEAVEAALSTIPNTGSVVGAGIDAPLFWTEDSGREVDQSIRDAIASLGAPYPAGTVQHFNSLQGACVVQGVLVANLLHKRFPEIKITESHPKALLYLLGIANEKRTPNSVSLAELKDVKCGHKVISEHERDAVLGAITAVAQREKRQGWRNLFKKEKNPVTPFDYPVEYWMPWDIV